MGEKKTSSPYLTIALVAIGLLAALEMGRLFFMPSADRLANRVVSEHPGAKDEAYALPGGKKSERSGMVRGDAITKMATRDRITAEEVQSLPPEKIGRIYIGDWSAAQPEFKAKLNDALDRKIAELDEGKDPKQNKALAGTLRLFKGMANTNFNYKWKKEGVALRESKETLQ